jgi:hypothetical protein
MNKIVDKKELKIYTISITKYLLRRKNVKKHNLLMIFLLSGSMVLAAEVIAIPGLGKPDSLTLFKGNLYITDRGSISIYSLPDAKLVKTFGRAGEGPGEFKISPIDKIGLRIVVRQENILVNSWGKLSIFTRDGTFIQEKKVTVNSATQLFKPLGKKYIGFNRANRDGVNYYLVNFYDPVTLQKEKEIHRNISFVTGNSLDTMRLALLFKQDTRRGPIFHVYNDRLFVEGEDCRIFVYDQQGNKLCSFTVHDYEKLEITADFKKKVMAYLEKRLPTAFIRVKQNGRFPKYFPLRSFRVSDGKLYVQTFKSEGKKSEFYKFDLEGKLLRKVMVPFQESEFLRAYPFAIDKGKIYQLIENDDTEEWELHINIIIDG